MSETPRTDAVNARDHNAVTGYYEMTEHARQLERELAEAKERIKGYEAQAQCFHEEYRRKCDVETKELHERLSDTQHRNGANIVRLERAEAKNAALREQLADHKQNCEALARYIRPSAPKYVHDIADNWRGDAEADPDHLERR